MLLFYLICLSTRVVFPFVVVVVVVVVEPTVSTNVSRRVRVQGPAAPFGPVRTRTRAFGLGYEEKEDGGGLER